MSAAHGTAGEVRLWPFTTRPEDVASYGPLQTIDGTRVFEIASLRPAKDRMVARLKGVTDRSAAEQLCNTDLYVPRERLPVPAEEMVQLDPQEAALLNLYRDNRVTTVGYVAGRFTFPGLFWRACGCEVRFPLAPDHQCPAHRTLHD